MVQYMEYSCFNLHKAKVLLVCECKWEGVVEDMESWCGPLTQVGWRQNILQQVPALTKQLQGTAWRLPWLAQHEQLEGLGC